MGSLSGKNAAVNGQSTARGWKINSTANLQSPIAKNSGGYPVTMPGPKDWKGSFDFYGLVPSVYPGTSFTFTGDTGAPGSYSGTAIVESWTLNINQETGETISGTVTFGGSGALTPGTTSVTDATSPDMNSPIDLPYHWDGAARTGYRSSTLVLSCDLKAIMPESSNGWMTRLAGNLSASGSWQEYEALPAALPVQNDIAIVKMYVTASTFWEIKYGRISSVDIDPNAESGDVVSATIAWTFSGWSSTTQGYIKKPSTVALWP